MDVRFFGYQVHFLQRVIQARRQPLDAGIDPAESRLRAELAQQYSRTLMQIITSVAILAFSFWIVIYSGSDQMQKAAFGLIGTVVGYWLR